METIRMSLEGVWECGCGCFSKCFSLRKVCQQYFFIFLKLFLRSTHQDDLKTSKTYYFKAKKKKKNSNFLKSAFQQQCQT
jgi:hypothetical protein